MQGLGGELDSVLVNHQTVSKVYTVGISNNLKLYLLGSGVIISTHLLIKTRLGRQGAADEKRHGTALYLPNIRQRQPTARAFSFKSLYP